MDHSDLGLHIQTHKPRFSILLQLCILLKTVKEGFSPFSPRT